MQSYLPQNAASQTILRFLREWSFERTQTLWKSQSWSREKRYYNHRIWTEMGYQRTLSCQECQGRVHNHGPPTRKRSSYVRSTLGTSARSSNYQLNDPLAIRITNWIILSETARIFDSLGLVAVILPAKLLLQTFWQLEVSWDKSVPEIIYTEFKDYLVDFKSKPDCVLDNGSTVELHGFCDASEKAYGTCVYLWAVNISWSIWSVQNHASLLSK